MSAFRVLDVAAQISQTQQGVETPLLARLMGLVGIAAMIALAWLLSNNRSKVNWRLVASGVVLQAAFGVLVLKTGVGHALFRGANAVFLKLLGFTEEGARFIFGNLVKNNVPVGTVSAIMDCRLTKTISSESFNIGTNGLECSNRSLGRS